MTRETKYLFCVCDSFLMSIKFFGENMRIEFWAFLKQLRACPYQEGTKVYMYFFSRLLTV